MVDHMPFQEELKQSTINVPRAALEVARSIAYPNLPVDDYMNRIDSLADAVRPQIEACTDLADQVDILSDFLFYQKNFRGNRSDYSDPRNSFLNCVLDRGLGVPISLGILYISVAQRLGMPAYGIDLPGHFIVGLYKEGREILIDPFNVGLCLSTRDCARLVEESTGYRGAFMPKWLLPVSPADVLARLPTNLCNAYIQRENWQKAIPVIQMLLLVQPDTDFHFRDLGYLYLYNGSLRLSAQYLEEYLRRAPNADDYENVRSSLQIVAGRLALWN